MASPTLAADLPENLLRLIPAETPAALVIPSLKACSDEMTQWLDGMERGQLLLGSRPLDQLKSGTGFTVGIDDLGSMAVFIAGFNQDVPIPMILVPVEGAASFLNGNFTAHDGDRHSRADGLTLFARDLQSHVLLSQDEAALRSYTAGEGLAPRIAQQFGDRGSVWLTPGDAFILVQRGGIEHMLKVARAEAARTEALLPGIAVFAMRLLEKCESGITVVDFDPLALVLRSIGRMSPTQANPATNHGDAADSARLDRLPNKPFYLAASVEVAQLAKRGALGEWLELADLNPTPDWLKLVHAAQWAVYPSSTGLAGGLLADAVMVAQTDQPQQLRNVIKQQLLSAELLTGDFKREVKWEDSKDVKDVGAADAYEVSITGEEAGATLPQMIDRVMFGSRGWRGFVKPTEDSVIITFSQRPAVLQAALSAAVDQSKSIESSAVLRTMRQWMPAQREIELYASIGQMAQLVEQVAATFGLTVEEAVKLDPNAPPIGFAAHVRQNDIETSVIIPAPVMAAAFDQFIKRAMKPADEPAVPPSPEAETSGGSQP
jgi:hypothetical protein